MGVLQRLSTDDTDDSPQQDLWLEREDRPLRFGRLRLASALMLAIPTFSIPALGPNRYLMGVLMILLVAPLTLVIERKAPVTSVDQWHTTLDTVVVFAAMFLLPLVYHGAALIASVAIASNGQYMGRIKYGFVAVTVAMFSIAGLYNEVPFWYLTTIGMCASLIPGLEFSKWYAIRTRLMINRFALVTESSAGFVWEFSPETNRFTKIQGQTKEQFNDGQQNLQDRLADDETAMECARTAVATGQGENLITLETATGEHRWFRLTAKSRRRVDQSMVVQGFAFDVTEIEQARQLSEIRAATDSLTGLPNRDGLVGFLGSKPGHCVGMALLDVDGFKLVNDTMGHLVGDQVIAALAQRIRSLASDDVCVARLGGDEFAVAVVAEDASVHSRINTISSAIISELERPLSVSGLELVVSASVGTAAGHGLAWTELLRRADVAMYEAKRSVTGVVAYSEQPGGGDISRLGLQADLAKGLEAQVELWFQPLVLATDRSVTGLEGLARWRHPTRGIVAPDEFLPMIEAAGLTERFDRHIIELTKKAVTKLQSIETTVGVSINMSARSLWSPRLLTQLRSLSADVRTRMTIELTEQGILDDHRGVTQVLDELRMMGIDLSLDDFGTGASSLIRLRTLPFNEVKIDRSFVAGCSEAGVDRAIVRSTIELAQELGLRTVAEGVETSEQADLLAEWGCDLLQGFLFGRPQPLESLLGHERLGSAQSNLTVRSQI